MCIINYKGHWIHLLLLLVVVVVVVVVAAAAAVVVVVVLTAIEFHLVAVQTKQVRKHIHDRNNTKTQHKQYKTQ
jgi:MFS superfamily sulfate permease-like transporter